MKTGTRASRLALAAGLLSIGLPAASRHDDTIGARFVGDTGAGAVSVDFATADGSATAGADFTATSGTIAWPAGDMGDRIVEVAIVDDALDESGETFQITLANAAGGATIEGSATIDVTIANDDGVVQPPPGGGGGGGWWRRRHRSRVVVPGCAAAPGCAQSTAHRPFQDQRRVVSAFDRASQASIGLPRATA